MAAWTHQKSWRQQNAVSLEHDLTVHLKRFLKVEFEILRRTLTENQEMFLQTLRHELPERGPNHLPQEQSVQRAASVRLNEIAETVKTTLIQGFGQRTTSRKERVLVPLGENVQSTALGASEDDVLDVDEEMGLPLEVACVSDVDDDVDVSAEDSHLLEACSNGTQEEVVALLEKRADPNAKFKKCKCEGIPVEFVSSSPLALATIRGDRQLVAKLLEFKANPNSEYSFLAGVEQFEWKGTAIHACVPPGDVNLMQQLLTAEADLEAVGSNGASLLWNAAYFGKDSVVDFLIMEGLDLEKRASSQDDKTLEFTALHVAASVGHANIVAKLLGAKAKVGGYAEQDRRPLDDAIKEAHPAVVKQLVQGCANLFDKSRLKSDCKGGLQEPRRIIDDLLDQPNIAVVSAAAEGLKDAGCTLDEMMVSDLIKFLGCAGDTPTLIMEAIFQPWKIQYWEMKDGKKHRAQLTSSAIDFGLGMNIAFGPHASRMNELYTAKEILAVKHASFLGTIAPEQTKHAWFGPRLVHAPVKFFYCPLHLGRRNLRVLVALVECCSNGNVDIFRLPATQALVELQWKAERPYARCLLLVALVQLANLLQILHSLKNNSEPSLSLVLAAAVWIFAVCKQCVEMLGFIVNGLHKRAFFSRVKAFERLVLILTGIVIFFAWSRKLDSMKYPTFRSALGILVYFKWVDVLVQFRQIKTVGINILPITSTMASVGPFVAVLSVYLLASANMYYAFANDNLTDSLFLTYRSAVLHDTILFNPRASEVQFEVQVMMVFTSFVMGVTMINIFVAVLCEAYSVINATADAMYLLSRAGIVLDMHALRTGLQLISNLIRSPKPVDRSQCRLIADDDESQVWFAIENQDMYSSA